MEDQFKKEIISYRFRTKKYAFETRHIQKTAFNDGKTKYIEDDPYMQLFLSEKCLRPSCGENCKYSDSNRPADITLTDYKGLYLDFPDLRGTKYNYTALIFNTRKGIKLKGKLSGRLCLYKSTLEAIKRDNPLFLLTTFIIIMKAVSWASMLQNERNYALNIRIKP